MRPRTRSEILAEVDEMADELMTLVPEATFEEAQAAVFEEFPDIYDEYRSSTPEMPSMPVAKSAPEPTVAEMILKALSTEAGRLAWTRWPSKTLADIEMDVWQSDEGAELYELYRGPDGRRPFSEARQTLGKSDAHRDVWATLERWLP